jgi:tetratricopeptide (TPR) repeat protein
MRALRLAVVVIAATLVRCAHTPESPTAKLDEAARSAAGGSHDARTLALAGFDAWLAKGDLKLARTQFDAAIKANADDPYALYGGMLLAEHDGHPEKAATLAIDLCTRASTHPLCSAAARRAAEQVGTSLELDEKVVEKASQALARGVGPDAAFLLRNALLGYERFRADAKGLEQTAADQGNLQAFTLLGPLSPYHVLAFDEPTAPEKTGSLEGPFTGPYGTLVPRAMHFPEGRFSLAGEPGGGDVYLVASDVKVTEGGTYVVRTVSADSLALTLDGTPLFIRRAFAEDVPTVNAKAVSLEPGLHRIIVRLAKPDRDALVTVSIARADGKPAGLAITPATGKAPRWQGVKLPESELAGLYPSAADFARALEPETGLALARFLAADDAGGRDQDGARALLDSIPMLTGAPVLATSARLWLHTHSVPQKVARGRATRDLEAALGKDPTDVASELTRAELALSDGRFDEVRTALTQARAAFTPEGFPVALLSARASAALGLDGQASDQAKEALSLQPGLCEANGLRYDLALKHDSVEEANALLESLRGCPGSLEREIEHARTRGQIDHALALEKTQLALSPLSIQAAMQLSELQIAKKQYADAVAMLAALRPSWPRTPSLLKRIGDVEALAGHPQEALEAREGALHLDGGDLPLRRIVEHARTGHELLDDLAQDGQKAIAQYEQAHPHEEAASSYILDAAGTRIYLDGSMVDRIHTIQKVLEQSAVTDIAEVNVPPGSQVLKLRTIKADGRTLEPERIENKETVSLPGVEPGDYVEEEYLLARSPRSAILPGFTASNFYFQVPRAPDHFATYSVRAPKGSGMEVDAHNLKAPAVRAEGEEEAFDLTVRDSPPLIPEPDSPPSSEEYLPFVVLGAGGKGQEPLVTYYADTYAPFEERTYEVEQFAKGAAAGKTGAAAVRAIYDAVMKKLSGRDSGLGVSAASSAAQDRGSRLMLLKASLESIGIPTRIVAVRTFAADPAPYKFPMDSLVPYVCLRVDVPGDAPIWLDPLVRFGPFGELPEQARGMPAWLFPEPGRKLESLTTPAGPAKAPKEVKLELALSATGELSGTGEETYQGFDAAALAQGLSNLSPSERDQALQGAISRYFGGASLSEVKLDIQQATGAPLIVRYKFTAPRFARVENGKIITGPLTFPAYLGRRYVEVGKRTLPLFIDSTERSHTVVHLQLPPGFTLENPDPKGAASSNWGGLTRTEQLANGMLTVEEDFTLRMSRVPVAQYDAFSQFAGEVDLLQSRDYTFAPSGSK